MPEAVEVKELCVDRGGKRVLHSLSFEVEQGRITGLLGPSGCGKTTLMRCVVGVQIIASGSVSVLGRAAGSLRERSGYVTQAPSVYGDLTARENLHYFGRVLRAPSERIDRTRYCVGPMSKENVELARRFNKPATSRAAMLTALPAMVNLCHPDVEWSPRGAGRTYRGREAVKQWLEGWLDSFDDYLFEVQRIVDWGGDQVLVVGLELGRGAGSGVEVRSLNYELLTIRDGLIVRYREFYDEGEALEAAGLRE